jgi:hypothetical protein
MQRRATQPSGDASPAIEFRDALRLVAKDSQLCLGRFLPPTRDWSKSPFLGERFESQPAAAITFRECNSTLANDAPIHA